MSILSDQRTYFIVGYDDKDDMKKMGGCWDPIMKRWYVLEGMDLVPFIRRWNLAEKGNMVQGKSKIEDKTEKPVRQCIYAVDLYNIWNSKEQKLETQYMCKEIY